MFSQTYKNYCTGRPRNYSFNFQVINLPKEPAGKLFQNTRVYWFFRCSRARYLRISYSIAAVCCAVKNRIYRWSTAHRTSRTIIPRYNQQKACKYFVSVYYALKSSGPSSTFFRRSCESERRVGPSTRVVEKKIPRIYQFYEHKLRV